ncbi:hypothetical protein [Actinoplanes sp. NPDC049802]|uniref:hypothetical protein n=1 Tax=Actinoplanes sp. NPDC049802 TaxID=3154742 RepID=UPI0033E4562E
MRLRGSWRILVYAAAATILAACGSGNGPNGAVTVADLRTPPVKDHFTGAPRSLRGHLMSKPSGCVSVVVDEVERMPLWPAGTSVDEDPDKPGRYLVTLPGGTTLTAEGDTGTAFSADGVIDENTGPYLAEPGVPAERITGYLAFCAVAAAPIAFPDAGTFDIRPG